MKSLRRMMIHTAAVAMVLAVSLSPLKAGAESMGDYTAFPPFLPRIVSPNIMFLLDYSHNMVKPAYGECDSYLSDCTNSYVHIKDDYDSTIPYYGYYDNGMSDLTDDVVKAARSPYDDSYAPMYTCGTGGSAGTQCEKDAAGVWNGNWLNWLTMTQFDIVKKVVVGGDINPAPDNQSASSPDLASNLVTMPNSGKIYKVVNDDNCTGRAANCGVSTMPQQILYNWIDTPSSVTAENQLSTVFGSPVDAVDLQGARDVALPLDVNIDGHYYQAGYSMRIFSQGYSYLYKTPGVEVWRNYLIPYYDYNCGTYYCGLYIDISRNSSVKTFVVGTAPNRKYVISWENLRHERDGGFFEPFNFQTIITEGSSTKESQVIFQLKNVQPTKSFGATPTNLNTYVGIYHDHSDGTVWTYVRKMTSNPGQPPGVTDAMALHATPGSSVYEIIPNASATKFKTLAPHPNSGDEYNVDINITSTARGASCSESDGWYGNDTENNKDKCYDHVVEGLFHEFRDGLLGGTLGFRLSIMRAGQGGSGTTARTDGGEIKTTGLHFNDKDTASLMTSTRGDGPSDREASLAEGLYEGMRYFRQDDPHWNNDYTNHDGDTSDCTSSGNFDPYCFASAEQKVDCCKSFVIIISSGSYTNDFERNIFDDSVDSAGDDPPPAGDWKATDDSGDEGTRPNEGWLDNIAYYAHTEDLRSDMDTDQTLGVYAVNTFGGGPGGEVLKKAARYGGFDDVDGDRTYDFDDANGNGICDPGEVDEEGVDCGDDPPTYFEASGGANLKDKISDAVMQILKSSASGTSVSVLSTSAGGQGAIYQAYFYPAKVEGQQDERSWPGYMRSFFIDKNQFLRDDASGGTYTVSSDGSASYSGTPDAKLTLGTVDGTTKGDYIAGMHLDANYQVRARLFEHDGDLENVPSLKHDILLDDIVSVWEAGEKLALQNKSNRNIYAWVDFNYDGVVNNGDMENPTGELITFDESKAADLIPFLRAGDPDGPFNSISGTGFLNATTEAVDIIDFIRGEYVTGYRNRCITVKGGTEETFSGDRRSKCPKQDGETDFSRVWPLGDIIYSTPTLVTGPAEKYDEIYGSNSYLSFRQKYADRRNVIYVGANDGMLHAFNAGFFEPEETKFCKGKDGNDTNNTIDGDVNTSGSECATGTYELGQELWGFIPHDNLPHLAWLACNGTTSDPSVCAGAEYTHVYFMDQRPKVSDVRIFSDDATHPGGWGTVLIAGMRYGGGAMDIDLDGDATIEAGDRFRSAYYIFDITDPEVKPKLLGRFSHDSLGFTTSYPSVGRLYDGTTESWFAVFGSGPKNETNAAGGGTPRDYGAAATTDTGKIFVVQLDGTSGFTNTMIYDTGDANSIMGDPAVIDVNLDFSVDTIYIGSSVHVSDTETRGKIYRLNTKKEPTLTNWDASHFSTLFSDPDMGPLLIPPSASMDIQGSFWVYFGTGILRNKNDMVNKEQQRFYAIKDSCWENTGVNCEKTTDPYNYVIGDLYNATNVVVEPETGSTTQVQNSGACSSSDGCSYNQLINHVRTMDGWYVDLEKDSSDAKPSERVLARSAVLGGLLLFTTYTPLNDICSVFGSSNIYALYYETGTAYNKPVFEGVDNSSAIQKKLSLGAGMPTAVGVAVGETVTGFVQKSTGEIVRIKAAPGIGLNSGTSSWREKAGAGNVEIEETYKHIVK